MEEDFVQCPFDDGDRDDDEWSRPVEEFDSCRNSVRTDVSCRPQRLQQSGSAPVPSKWDHPRTIVHIDVDCFYAQVEMILNPALRDVPLGIQQKYIVVTCNYPAREWGVTKLMAISEAKKKCPELVLVSGEDLTRYREMSYKISDFLMKYTPCVERLGFDENFLDVTEMVDQRIQGGTAKSEVDGHVYSPQDSGDESDPSEALKTCSCGCQRRMTVGSQIAADIRSALNIELGITCCAGIGHNKLLAKLVGSLHKPNQQTTVYPCHGLSLVTGLKTARHIPGIGSATSRRLKALGVETVADLQRFSKKYLEEEFGGPLATTIHSLAFGIDDSPVVTYSKPQMLSIEDSFRRCSSEKDAMSRVSQLISNLLPRMREDGRCPRTLRLTVRKANKENHYQHRESRQCSLPSGIAARISSGQLEVAQKLLVSMAMSLFHKMVDTKQLFHLTLISVAFAKLEDPASNSITTFFTSPSATVMSPRSKELQESPDTRFCDSPESTGDKAKGAADRTRCHVSANHPKRTGGLASFFAKKRKMDETTGDSIDPTEQHVRSNKDLTERRHSSPDVMRNITFPEGVDPDVFVQLPVEIQQEILRTVPQVSSSKTTPTLWSPIPAQNSCCIKQGALSSTSDSIHRSPTPGQGKEKTLDGNCLQTKKAIFRPAELKNTQPFPAQCGTAQEIRQKTNSADCRYSNADPEDAEYAKQKDCCPSEETDFSLKSDGLSQQNIQNCHTSSQDLETSDRTVHSSQQIAAGSQARDITSSEGNSLTNSFHCPKMSVPKGVDSDVFCALPLELQREVSAEMAMKKHNMVLSPGHAGAGLKKGATKSPAKRANSILNYLKKT